MFQTLEDFYNLLKIGGASLTNVCFSKHRGKLWVEHSVMNGTILKQPEHSTGEDFRPWTTLHWQMMITSLQHILRFMQHKIIKLSVIHENK